MTIKDEDCLFAPESEGEIKEIANDDAIHLDAMGFGMGACCLQITFQAWNLDDARRLYDQLAILCPILVILHYVNHLCFLSWQ